MQGREPRAPRRGPTEHVGVMGSVRGRAAAGAAVLRNPRGWGIAHTHRVQERVPERGFAQSCHNLWLERLTERRSEEGCLQVVVKENAGNRRRTP